MLYDFEIIEEPAIQRWFVNLPPECDDTISQRKQLRELVWEICSVYWIAVPNFLIINLSLCIMGSIVITFENTFNAFLYDRFNL